MNNIDDRKTRDYLRYRLHCKLKSAGNKVFARQRWVVKRAEEVSALEGKWLNQLIALNYCICDDMFNK